MIQPAYASCIQDEDWPGKPCLDMPPYSEDYIRQVWSQYHEYKGGEWMEAKKSEMDLSIQNDTLRQWVETRSAPNNFANYNVWYYYYVNGAAPNAYGPQPTQEQLKKCRELGIDIGRCSDIELLKGKCIGCNAESQPPIVFDAALVSLFLGVGAAVVGGVWLFARTRKVKNGSSE